MREGVALVYPFFREENPVEEEKLFPPLSVAYLAGQMKERGVAVSVHDGTFLTPDEIIRDVVGEEPAIVSIYLMITMCRNGMDLLERLRTRLPGTLFITGGPLATLYPERFAEVFDVVFCGEGDITVPRFCDDYCLAGSNPADLSALDLTLYPGIFLRRRDTDTRDTSRQDTSRQDTEPGYPDNESTVIRVPPVHQPLEVIERLPLPDRSVFDHRRYQEFWERTLGCRMTSIMVTRGCPYSCDFCSKPVWGNDFRKPSLERVFAEIRDILSYGYNRLWIADDSFTLDTGYLEEFCKKKIADGFPFTWTCLSRVDRLDEEIVGLMKEAGCVRVHLGLESGNDETLKLMGKRVSVSDGIEAVRLFQQAGIETAGFFIVGYPGETDESIDETLALAVSLPLDEISINVPFPLPGSPLFSRVAAVDTTAEWKTANEISFIYESEFDETWLRERIREAKETFAKKKEDDSVLFSSHK
jgi:anaerobic magnesium-protoporphyrin IX monomethyl ester cyclase